MIINPHKLLNLETILSISPQHAFSQESDRDLMSWLAEKEGKRKGKGKVKGKPTVEGITDAQACTCFLCLK